eukprot:PhM_4_TR222/c0_g1_i1/m.100072
MPEPIQAGTRAAKQTGAQLSHAGTTMSAEIAAGGFKGILGLDQITWPGHAGECWEFWRCSPCCGDPINFMDCISCVLQFWFCGPCVAAKLFATSVNQECAVWPHCFPLIMCCSCITAPMERYNLRKKAGVSGNIIGDIVCLYCCSCCAGLQTLRSVPIEAWSLYPFKAPQLATDCKLMN